MVWWTGADVEEPSAPCCLNYTREPHALSLWISCRPHLLGQLSQTDELPSHAHIFLFSTHRSINHLLLPNFLLLERLDGLMHKRPTSLVCTWRGHYDLAELILCSSFHISLAQPYSSVFRSIFIPEQIWKYLAVIKPMHLMAFELYWQTNWIRDKHQPWMC